MPFTQNYIIAPSNNPNDFKLIAYEANNPNVSVEEHIITAPHINQQTASFINLRYVAHRFRLFEWNGSTLGTMLHDVLVQPTEEYVFTPPDIELVVGVDLIDGQTQWDGLPNYPQYSGYNLGTDFRVIQRGVSNLKTIEAQQYGLFGFELLGSQVFTDGDTYFIEFLPKLVINPANYTGYNNNNNNGYVDIVELGVDTILNNTYLNKLISINRNIDYIAPVFELPPTSSWTDMSSIGFSMNLGMQINAIIRLAFGETIWFNNSQVNEIYIGKNEYIKITKKGTELYVENTNIDYNSVGHIIQSYGLFFPYNKIQATGTLVDRNIFVRLWKTLEAMPILTSLLIDDSVWLTGTNNRKYFSKGDGATNFRLPDLLNNNQPFIYSIMI